MADHTLLRFDTSFSFRMEGLHAEYTHRTNASLSSHAPLSCPAAPLRRHLFAGWNGGIWRARTGHQQIHHLRHMFQGAHDWGK